MRWVFDDAFVGLDRREGRSLLRLRERRLSDATGEPPALPTALRQLMLAAFDVDDSSLLKFSYHASSVTMLATALGRDDVAEPLREMMQFLSAPSNREAREQKVQEFLLEARSRVS